ncbi:MAG: phenylalanine 4-monooxygenase [Pyrinomonadaceae bacterium]|nr:phenylalanine 4-monooxygenase [Pyrinomonadaceae bacterium]
MNVNESSQISDNILTEEISVLPIDHPGARDEEYRVRRNHIARLAGEYRLNPQKGIPIIEYTEEETAVWRHAFTQLDELHRRKACSLYLDAKRRLGLSADAIPQLRDLDRKLSGLTGFHLAPVDGLVETRAFLSLLEKRVMLSTQYIRHHSRPDYTPEPDIVHESIGHIPNLTNEDFADFSQFIGRGARIASEEQLLQLGRLYWFTVEFGLIEEDGGIKAFGAGLMSSYHELERAFSDEVERKAFNLEEVIETNYDYSALQPVLFVIPSYGYIKDVTHGFIESFAG